MGHLSKPVRIWWYFVFLLMIVRLISNATEAGDKGMAWFVVAVIANTLSLAIVGLLGAAIIASTARLARR